MYLNESKFSIFIIAIVFVYSSFEIPSNSQRSILRIQIPNSSKSFSNCEEETSCDVTLDFSYRNFDRVHKFISSQAVTTLNFSSNRIRDFEPNAFEEMPHIRKLDLSNNRIPVANLFSFGSLAKLKVLILNNNHGWPINSTLSIENFYPSLESLFLRNVGARNMSVENWNVLLPKLWTLDLSENEGLDAQHLIENFLPTLKNVYLEKNALTFINASYLPNLETLILDGNNFSSLLITDDSTSCRSANQICLGPMMGLKTFSASDCGISDFIAHYFLINSLPNLKSLKLEKNKLTAINDQILAIDSMLSRFGSVEFLDLSENGLKSVEKLCLFPYLKVLRLNYMSGPISAYIDWNGIGCLINLKEFSFAGNDLEEVPKNLLDKLKNLERLNLSDNSLSEFSMLEPEYSILRVLILKNNNIKNFEDLELSKIKTLEELDLRGNQINKIKVSLLKNLLDHTVIEI